MKPTEYSDEKLKKIIRILDIVLIVFYPIMTYYFSQSKDPVNIMESQLSFDATTLRLEYFTILTEGGMDAFTIAQSLDFGFMVLYGSLMSLVCLRWSNKISKSHNNDKIWYKVGYVLAVLVIVAALSDMVENIYIHKMIGTQPLFNFPDQWAIIHSTFALIKWLFLFSTMAWYIAVRLKYK